jgi:hypothetical protein
MLAKPEPGTIEAMQPVLRVEVANAIARCCGAKPVSGAGA